MPYTATSVPSNIKRYSAKLRRMWSSVWNSTYKKVLKETKNKKEAEQRAFKSANSVLKRNVKKFGVDRYGHASHMSYMVDIYLKRLPG